MAMTKTDWQQRFKKVGIRRQDIFNEIMRAKKIDQVLFSNPVNRVYGVGGEDIIRTMRELTTKEYGVFNGTDDAYLSVFETAMAAPAIWFHPHPIRLRRPAELISYWHPYTRAKRVLLWGVERYMEILKDIENIFPYAQVTIVVTAGEMAKHLPLIYPQIECLSADEIPSTRKFDYVFVWGAGEDSSEWKAAWQHRASEGHASAWWEHKNWYGSERAVSEPYQIYYVGQRRREEQMIVAETDGTRKNHFGVVTYRNQKWTYTRTTKLEWQAYWKDVHTTRRLEDIVSVVKKYVEVDALTRVVWEPQIVDLPLCDVEVHKGKLTKGYAIQKGDILVSIGQDSYRVALVMTSAPDIVAETSIWVLRPNKEAVAWELFLWLIRPETRARLQRKGIRLATKPTDLLQISIPEMTGEKVCETKLVTAFQQYAKAVEKWQKECQRVRDSRW